MALSLLLRALLAAAWAASPVRAQEGESHDAGCVHLQIVHSTNAKVFKRAVQFNLANRSDVAYYAKRELWEKPGGRPRPKKGKKRGGSFPQS